VVSLLYRKDIDGLRGLSVIIVILYHSGFTLLSGGFVGVDVFFVISGYLITTIVFNDIKNTKFSFLSFYKKRAVRLLPALNIMLLLVLIYGFLFYTNKTYDVLGKEVAFSALGLVNLLFAQGANYFASEQMHKPLVHMWSLGVEEQFYLFWPITIVFLYKFSKNLITLIIICCLLIGISLVASETVLSQDPVKAYFYPHYRAYELLLGAVLAFILINSKKIILYNYRNFLSGFGFILIIFSSVLFSRSTGFPGVYALVPCFGAALIIVYSSNCFVERILSSQMFWLIGLVSYPLYLYHQPVLSFIHLFYKGVSAVESFVAVLFIALPLSWLTYKFVEQPIRVKSKRIGTFNNSIPYVLIAMTLVLAFVGLYIAKNQGLEWRFKLLNSFSYNVSKKSESSFHMNLSRGEHKSKSSDILFIGDSVLQHYVVPIAKSLDIPLSNVSSVTRGGCVLLKGVDFLDKFSDISCGDLREGIYLDQKVYKLVVISQSWLSYDESMLNVTTNNASYQYSLEKWKKYLDSTIEFFSEKGTKVIIIADHLSLTGTELLQPSVFLNKTSYINQLSSISVVNQKEMIENNKFFIENFSDLSFLLFPVDIWCKTSCMVHDGSWSFFSDSHHITVASEKFISKKLDAIFKNEEFLLFME